MRASARPDQKAETEVVRALAGMKDDVEAALVQGLRAVMSHDERTTSRYHRRMAVHEMWNLNRGEDCCYDRPGTGFAYASWYHPRRVREMTRRLVPIADEIEDGSSVLDLGAGTGATAWALAVVSVARREIGLRVATSVRVLALEASPSMRVAADLLWGALCDHLPGASCIEVQHVARPWLDPPELSGGVLVAGHLFDASDRNEEIKRSMQRVLTRSRPRLVLLDAPDGKKLKLRAAVEGATAEGLESRRSRISDSTWSGTIDDLTELRRAALEPLGVHRDQIGGPVAWGGGPSVVRADLVSGGTAGDRLFSVGPMGLALDDEQEELAEPRERLGVVVGAAGSGKSVILVERIVRSALQAARRTQPIDFLVTTRNVPMTDQLWRWTLDRLRSVGIDPRLRVPAEGNRRLTWPTAAGEASIRFLNWDKVPTQLFDVAPTGSGDRDAIMQRIKRREAKGWAPLERYPHYLSQGAVDWLSAELRRVIHGQGIRSLDGYMAAIRAGRGVALAPQIRPPVWELLVSEGQRSFTYLWMDLVDRHAEALAAERRIVPEATGRLFTHSFVDEVQDFTRTDIEFLAAMVDDPRRVMCVGDAGQAILLGATFDFPGRLRKRQREVNVLTRSYRMTRRLAEAVQPLAEAMVASLPSRQKEWVGVPDGTRSGVLGARPVVVLADGSEGRAIAEVLAAYSDLFAVAAPQVTAAEAHDSDPLLRAVRDAVPDGVPTRPETVAKIKGLERTCVVWSTDRRWKVDESAAQFVHTVLTRATALAVIVLVPDATDRDIVEALGHLRRDRLLFWTEAAEAMWAKAIPVV